LKGLGFLLFLVLIGLAPLVSGCRRQRPQAATKAPAAAPAPVIAWGKPVAGLRAGIRSEKRDYSVEEAIKLTLYLKNVSDKPVALGEWDFPTDRLGWFVRMKADGGGVYKPYVLKDLHTSYAPLNPLRSLAPGRTITAQIEIGKGWRFDTIPRSRVEVTKLPACGFEVTATHMHGETAITTGVCRLKLVN